MSGIQSNLSLITDNAHPGIYQNIIGEEMIAPSPY